MAGSVAQAEFSRVVETERVQHEPLELTFEATPDERVKLAERLGLVTLDSLTASAKVRRDGEGRTVYLVDGQFAARVVQSCVVTLEPVVSRIEAGVERIYAEDAEVGAEAWVDAESDDPPEPLIGGRIDVGEAVVEELALSLDPYPRRAGAELPSEYTAEPDAESRENPFAVLRRLAEKS